MTTALATLTVAHVAISLIGLASGFVLIAGLIRGKLLDRTSALFLVTTIATSLSGFLFPIHQITPGLVIGVLSLILLAFTVYARYSRSLTGRWRPTFVITAVVAQYLNFFVLVVQLFLKVPALNALAPTQTIFAVAFDAPRLRGSRRPRRAGFKKTTATSTSRALQYATHSHQPSISL
jgi:hypothetical protein